MGTYPKTVRLRDGSDVVLRPMTKDDGDLLFEFFSALPDEDRQFLRNDVSKRSTIDAWVNNIQPDQIWPIVALHEKKIVADGTLHVEQYGWWRHLGEIRMVVAKSMQRKGLGMAVARGLYQQAQKRHLHKLMVSVLQSQTGAVRAFERLGFITEALLRNHVTDHRGNKHDLRIMTSDLEDLWQKVEDMMQDAAVRASVQAY